MTERKLKAVVFDNGGVLLRMNQSLTGVEEKCGLPKGTIMKVIFHPDPELRGPWKDLECGRISLETFERDHLSPWVHKNFPKAPVSSEAQHQWTKTILSEEGLSGTVADEMLVAVRKLRQLGYKTAILTNNWHFTDDNKQLHAGHETFKHLDLFDLLIESCVVGMHKPNADIYEHTCEKLGVKPDECVFLDDLPWNVEAAVKLGMKGIRVKDRDVALREMEKVLGLEENALK